MYRDSNERAQDRANGHYTEYLTDHHVTHMPSVDAHPYSDRWVEACATVRPHELLYYLLASVTAVGDGLAPPGDRIAK